MSRFYFLMAFAVVIIVSIFWGINILDIQSNQNQMANFVSVPYEHPEWPDKKNFFDASQWLDQKDKYVKIDDFYLLDLAPSPLVINSDNYLLFRLLQEEIKGAEFRLRNLRSLAALKEDELGNFPFYKKIYSAIIDSEIEPEYLYTSFDDDTHDMKPIVDYYILTFLYKDEFYEVELARVPRPSPLIDGEVSNMFYIYSIDEGRGSWRKKNEGKKTYRQYSKMD